MSVRLVLRCLVLACVVLSTTSLGVGAQSAAPPLPANPTVKLAKIPVPGKPLASFDISWVDPIAGKYYLADRTNSSIDVVSIATNQVIQQIGGFKGFTGKNSSSGPDGVIVTFSNKEAWAGDGDSTVKVVDLQAGKIVASISSGGKLRVDEMTYDPKENIIIAANNADDPPFVTFFSVGSRTVLKKIEYPDAEGLEQPYYDADSGNIYMSVDHTKKNPGGQIDEIDPKTLTVSTSFPLNDCDPTGLTGGYKNQILVGCGTAGHMPILDKITGKILADFPNAPNVDEVWFNPGDNRYYGAGSGPQQLAVIDAATMTLLQNVETGLGAHSVAADPVTNHIFAPVAAPDPACPSGCIAVWTNANLDMKGLTGIRPLTQ